MMLNEQLAKLRLHSSARFRLLHTMLDQDEHLAVVIAGKPNMEHSEGDLSSSTDAARYGVHGHQLGVGIARNQWRSDGHWRSNVHMLDEHVAALKTQYLDRVSIGSVGYATTGPFRVHIPPGRQCLHVWGANMTNWNCAVGEKFGGMGQAASMSAGDHRQQFGSFGVVTTPVGWESNPTLTERLLHPDVTHVSTPAELQPPHEASAHTAQPGLATLLAGHIRRQGCVSVWRCPAAAFVALV